MLDDAPAALRETLACAEAETRGLGHGYVGSEHLLLGLLRLESTRAAGHLRRASVDHARVRERIVTIVGLGDDDVGTQQILPFTPNAVSVCRRVLKDAEKTGAANIGTEHVLRAVLLSRESLAVRVLESLGVDRMKIQRDVRRPHPDAG